MQLVDIGTDTESAFFTCLHLEEPENLECTSHRRRWYEEYKAKGYKMLALILVLLACVGCARDSGSEIKAAEYYNAAAMAYNSGDYESAMRGYSRAIEADPDFELAYIGRGTAHSQIGNLERAIEDFSKAIELNPDSDYAYQSRGDAHILMGNWERAIADYSTAIVLQPASLKAYLGRADAYRLLGQFDEAIQDATEAIALDDIAAMAYAIRGSAYADLEEWEKAVKDYNQALRLLNTSNTLLAVGSPVSDPPIVHLPEAIADLEQYAQTAADPSVQVQIADLLERLRDEQISF